MPRFGIRLTALALLLALSLAMTPTLPGAASAQPATPVAQNAEANKALVRQFFEIASSGDLRDLAGITTPDFVVSTAPPGESPDLEGLVGTLEAARAGLPDFAIEVDDLVAQGDLVAARTTISGTHLGNFFGAPPTGRPIETEAIDLWRVEDGKLAENWHLEDILGVMEQLGAVPLDAMPRPDTATPPGPSAAGARLATPDAETAAANALAARRFRGELFTSGSGAAAEILAPDVVWHFDVAAGREAALEVANATRAAFPDLTLSIDLVVAEGDQVAVLWTMRGTQQGEYFGVPASGNLIITPGIDIYRFVDGQIVEIWTVGDDLGLLLQLDALPAFGGEAAATPAA